VLMHLPGKPAGGVIERPEDRPALVGPSGGDAQRLAATLPDGCQVGMGVEVAFIHIDKPEASPGKSPLFWSSASAGLAELTASASCRWVRSCRGRR